MSNPPPNQNPPGQSSAPQIVFMPAGRDWMQIIATGLPGLAAVAALFFAFLQVGQANNQLRLSQQGQITDQLNTATTNLASNSTDVRLGGIAALETIMQESKQDQPSVLNILSAYVRSHAPLSGHVEPVPDVSAALMVIGKNGGAADEVPDPSLSGRYFLTDLTDTDLQEFTFIGNFPWATLAGSNLAGAHFEASSFRKGVFTKANIRNGHFRGVHFQGANFTGAHLENADFTGAHLAGAIFTGADLTGANFSGADTSGANFTRATTEGVRGLTKLHLH